MLFSGEGEAAKQKDDSFIDKINEVKKGRINYISALQRNYSVLGKQGKLDKKRRKK